MVFTSEHLLRELSPQVLGAVIRRYGDFAAAEDAVQEALPAAAMQCAQPTRTHSLESDGTRPARSITWLAETTR